MADIAEIANGESNADIRAKLNIAIGRTNTGTFAEAAIGGATDYVEIAADGTVTLKGAATAWDDLLVELRESVTGQTLKPDWDATNFGLLFPRNSTTEFVAFNFQMPHRWKEGSTVYPHVHFLQDQNLAPTFKLDYRWVNIGELVPAWTTGYTMGTLVGSQTWTTGLLHRIVSNATGISATGKAFSSALQIKLYRDDNTYVGDCITLSFGLHFEIDSFGTSSEYAK